VTDHDAMQFVGIVQPTSVLIYERTIIALLIFFVMITNAIA
jgi:hypothetical protein